MPLALARSAAQSMHELSWRQLLDGATRLPELRPNQVHVWHASRLVSPDTLTALEALLAEEERLRADKFHFRRHRDCFVVGRGLLRRALALYSQAEDGTIQFEYGPQGKPRLRESFRPQINFSVSHSSEAIVLAFSRGDEVGVDIERIREDLDFVDLAQHSFSQPEALAVQALPVERRPALFFEYWTCKEACIKADGRGLSAPLSGFCVVTSSKGPPWREVQVLDQTDFSSEWRIRLLEGIAGCAGAVAAAGVDWDILRVRLAE